MDGNANPCGEFTEYCIRSSEARELVAKLTSADFATWRPLPASHYQVYEPKMDVLVAYCLSLILLDAISETTIAEYFGQNFTFLKLLLETTLYCCNRLCFDKQFHCRNVVLH